MDDIQRRCDDVFRRQHATLFTCDRDRTVGIDITCVEVDIGPGIRVVDRDILCCQCTGFSGYCCHHDVTACLDVAAGKIDCIEFGTVQDHITCRGHDAAAELTAFIGNGTCFDITRVERVHGCQGSVQGDPGGHCCIDGIQRSSGYTCSVDVPGCGSCDSDRTLGRDGSCGKDAFGLCVVDRDAVCVQGADRIRDVRQNDCACCSDSLVCIELGISHDDIACCGGDGSTERTSDIGNGCCLDRA